MDSKQLYREAHTAFAAGDFARAEKLFSAFLQRYGDEPLMSNALPRVKFGLGCSLYSVGKYDAALPYLTNYVAQMPNDETVKDTFFRIADMYQQRGEYVMARTAYTNLLSRFKKIPHKDDVYFQIAVSYLAEEAYTNAIPLLKSIGSNSPDEDLAGAAK